MTDLRKAAEMVCELWFNQGGITAATFKPYMEALRQALAQPEQDELLKQGWRQCAVGQRTTQYCGMAEQARLEEREACAEVCDRYAENESGFVAEDCAAAIRARSEK